MTLRENNNITDQAWNSLHERLEKEGLLTDNKTRKVNLRYSVIKWGAVAAIVCVCIISLIIALGQQATRADMLTLNNEKNAPTMVSTLEDGSIVYLSEYTSLHYPDHFSDNKREVFLEGNAYFDISRDPTKPFVIDTKHTVVEVLGTSFNIKSMDNESFSLSVRHGEVKVTSKIDGKIVYVKAGETALLRSDNLQKINTTDIDQFKSYLKRIYFKDQRLSDVVKMINMNSDSVQIKIVPELENRRLTVTFSDDTPDTMAKLISLALNLQIIQQQNTITISPK